jgi:chorismate mutase
VLTELELFNFEIENHERQLEQTLLEQLKIAKSVAEAKQFCTTV